MNFASLAKKGFEAYEQSQENVSKTGGHELNRGSHSSHATSKQPDFDDDEVVSHANQHAPDSGSSDLFKQAMSFVKSSSKADDDDLDEEKVIDSHKRVYEKDEAKSVPASDIGSAAAIQVLKQFVGGDSKDKSSASGGSFQNKLIAAAMGEAAKRFDSSGGAAEGNKQDAVNGAAATIMKLLVKSQFSGGTVGGSDSGGLGSLAGLASKYMK